jgi:CDP-glucose 4,6-dehydratase
MNIPSPNFWNGKRVLLTGHTGFKGAWLSLWLSQMGANVIGVSLPPIGIPNLFDTAHIASLLDSHFLDIRDGNSINLLVKKSEPEIVFHLAAQALVRQSYIDPLGTFGTNLLGTANILNSLRELKSAKVIVAVTTDKVYKNLERKEPYSEKDILGGHDPYSASKAASEIIISSYRDAYLAEQGVGVASARAGNVIGGGDWSVDRLIPDAINAWNSDRPLVVRRPNAVRPWQHVVEPLAGYLVLAERLYDDIALAGAYNFGPKAEEAATVREAITYANQVFGRGSIVWGNRNEGPHEANLLLLEITKASEILGITSCWSLREAISRTISWYQEQKCGVSARLLCESDIKHFIACKKSILQ